MKRQRRHELQHNVLDAELAKVVAFVKRRGTHLAGGLLIAAILVFVIVSLVGSSRAADEQRQRQFYQQIRAQGTGGLDAGKRIDVLKSLAGQDGDERLAALATVAVGDAYANQAAVARPHMAAEGLRELTDQAARWYEKAVGNFRDQPLATAKGHYGLAKLAETRGDFDAAREHYAAIREMRGLLVGQPVQLFALEASNRLAEITDPVRMASTAPADPNATTAPADANVPGPGPATGPASRPGEEDQPVEVGG